ncbi:MAG: hypothetical protein NDI69_01565 [Bacteriovoracaceae bacterium]|nr:hypothetical protein [Bacteriovoracaceae bacterium]
MKMLIILSILFVRGAISADVYVRSYQRSDGTYVAPHTRSAPDDFKWNNYGEPTNDIEKRPGP